jgi:DNA-binding transcriptional LysR family regulator
MPQWIGAFVDRFPKIQVEVRMLDPRGLERAVMSDRIHAAIVPIHRPVAGLVYEPIGSEANYLYCGAQHPLYQRRDAEITRDDLEAGGLISRGYLDNFDADFFGTAVHQATVSEIEAAAVLVLSGRFIGFLPEHYALGYVRSGLMRAIKPDTIGLHVSFALAYKKAMEGDKRISALVSICCAEAYPRPRVASSCPAPV